MIPNGSTSSRIAVAGDSVRPKYAPARDDGLKPFIVTLYECGQSNEFLVYAASKAAALVGAARRQPRVTATARRATLDEITP